MNEQVEKKPLFPLGQVVATPGALRVLYEADDEPLHYMLRHQQGDWGEVPPEDAAENELSVKEGFRIMSVYTLGTGIKVWVITESDRSATTILLPREY